MKLADGIAAALPRPQPSAEALRRCKLVSHRGEHDNRRVFENTLPAFAAARSGGVWGIEFDLRWTADLVPVVLHDPDGRRVFGDSTAPGTVRFSELRKRLPLIPSVEELLADFGGNTHLMIELKAEDYREPVRQSAALEKLLENLEPIRHYHFLALDPNLFRHVAFAPPTACLPVAEFNVSRMSEISLSAGYGGLTGHYLLLGAAALRRHGAAGQSIGTGHIGSRNVLFREIGRGVEWIFSNDAVAMQRLLDHCLADT